MSQDERDVCYDADGVHALSSAGIGMQAMCTKSTVIQSQSDGPKIKPSAKYLPRREVVFDIEGPRIDPTTADTAEAATPAAVEQHAGN